VIDLHLHLLPGVDDGPETFEQSLRMCRLAADDGCVALVATPHQRRDEWRTDDPEPLRARLAELAERTGGTPRLYLGGEVRVDSDLMTDLARPGRAGLRTLAGSRYLLIELDPEGIGPDPVELAAELGRGGFFPVVAHPELTSFLWAEEDLIDRMVDAGALLQVTAMSVTGQFGRVVRDRVWSLLDADLVHFVASDAHRPDWRPPGLSHAHGLIAERLGLATAQRLTVANPMAVIEDRALTGAAAEGVG